MFINIPSILVVVFGTATVVLMKYPLSHTLGSIKIALKAFFHQSESQLDLITQGIKIADICRREGFLGLEGVEISNKFLNIGIQLTVDGEDPAVIDRILNKEISLTIERHEMGTNIFRGVGETAPAMGMIGTLIGLVQMMANMSDPQSIGPAMAVALLTTLYGAVMANVVSLPIADKLEHRSTEEKLNKGLILEIIRGIHSGVNPRVLEQMLKTYLPSGQRPESIFDDMKNQA